jgi:hypothetical protein
MKCKLVYRKDENYGDNISMIEKGGGISSNAKGKKNVNTEVAHVN